MEEVLTTNQTGSLSSGGIDFSICQYVIRLADIINTKLRKKYILCNLGEIKREEKKLQVTIKSRKTFIREGI